jgi:hypothetical protein
MGFPSWTFVSLVVKDFFAFVTSDLDIAVLNHDHGRWRVPWPLSRSKYLAHNRSVMR